MRDVHAPTEATPCRRHLRKGDRGVQDVEQAVPGVGPGSDVPSAPVGGVGGHPPPAGMTSWSNNQMGHESMQATIQQRLADVHVDQGGLAARFHLSSAPQRPAEVTARQHHGRTRRFGCIISITEDAGQKVR